MPINQTLQNIERSIGRLEGKVDGINSRLDKANGSLINHDKRINKVEDGAANISGKATVIGAIAGFLVSVVVVTYNFLFKSQ